ncbi:MAG: polysaccharide deacetylase family protein [Syntrophales bacterium]|nr:polysaccharide deacetylase family protein [Syntrophales bacterium]
MSVNGILGLKIDVDTYQGMKKGVPRLMETLARHSIRGTFYLSMGPDASGLAVLQILKNPLFLKKMIHTNAPGLYGFRTALYGTLLPSPMIGLSFPRMIKEMISLGHEVQFHAWDHRRWQDGLFRRSETWIRQWFEKGIAAFREITGHDPSSFGAPAWLIDDRVLRVLKDFPFEYLSCTRAKEPFIHEQIDLLEIPSDLPCFEETGVKLGKAEILKRLAGGGIHVLPVHAEAEGGIWQGSFVALLEDIKKLDYSFSTLDDIRRAPRLVNFPRRRFRMELLPGRSVPCCV